MQDALMCGPPRISGFLFVTQLDNASLYIVGHGSVVLRRAFKQYLLRFCHKQRAFYFLIVLTGLDTGVQAATELFPSLEKVGEGVAHSFNCPPPFRVWLVCVC